jgi:hypothetical protein
MILTREIIIKINESNFSYYEELGYEDVCIGETIIIPIELLSTGSHYKIDCKCDTCGLVKEVIFKNYVKYGNRWGEYFCRKCSEKKRKETLQKNHGVEYPIQNKEIMDKMKNTMIEKFGVDNASKSKEIIQKKKKEKPS